MPPQCFYNALGVADIPHCMKELKQLEKQIIKKSLPFIKMRQLPKTRMPIVNDRLINVPITDDDVLQTVTSLPRTPDKDGFINLKLKRKMEYKSYHMIETVRPHYVYDSLAYLKDNHPEYKLLKIIDKDEYLRESETITMQHEEENEVQNDLVKDESEESSESDQSEAEVEDESAFNAVTCLCPEDPTIDVIVNTSSKSI